VSECKYSLPITWIKVTILVALCEILYQQVRREPCPVPIGQLQRVHG
jgi:hypothetical protein